ncbi:unnamed protein product [Phytophthora fragariaefolia]|uniref:Sugar transporter SWEET1 n=1 Tax=Phytophthora fragariaefolia TaxID=1490495 RepID=A0A9W6XDL7_9STRA|nr:unnamed protein product [Phytophthora fragariaefolia]
MEVSEAGKRAISSPWTAQSDQHQHNVLNRPSADKREPSPASVGGGIYLNRGYRGNSKFAGSDENGSGTVVEGDIILWQHRGFLEKCQHLLILWRFLQFVSLDDASACIHSCWLSIYDALRVSKPSASIDLKHAIDSLLIQTVGNPIISPSLKCLRRRNAVTRMAAYLLIRTQFSSAVQHLVKTELQVERNTTSGVHLQDRFVLLVSNIYEYVSDVLCEAHAYVNLAQPVKDSKPLPSLVDDVLSLVYGQTHFAVLREEMSTLLMRQQAPGSLSDTLNTVFQLFVAQVRDASATFVHNLSQSQTGSTIARSPFQSSWSRRWLLDPTSTQLVNNLHCNQVAPPNLQSLIYVMQTLHEFGCVDLEVDDSMSCVVVRSALSVLNDRSMMELALDGRLRALHRLPSGLIALVGLAGRWSVCDYAAVFSCSGQSLDVDLFVVEAKRGIVGCDASKGAKGAANAKRCHEHVVDEEILRRVRLVVALEGQLNPDVVSRDGTRGPFMCVHVEISGATYLPLSTEVLRIGSYLLGLPLQARDEVYRSLEWTPLMEMQMGYVACQAETFHPRRAPTFSSPAVTRWDSPTKALGSRVGSSCSTSVSNLNANHDSSPPSTGSTLSPPPRLKARTAMGSSALVTLLHMTTAAIQIGMNLSPAPDMLRVHQLKTTGQMALLPLVLMCFNNHLWLLYGLLTGSIFPLCAAALVGEVAGLIFTATYCRWARNTVEARRTCGAALLGMALVTLYVLLGVSGKTAQTFDQVVQTLGYVGAAINISMYASPLATIKVVLETKSSASLPINLCGMICLNCCMWTATSLVDGDMFVLIPSVIGLAFSSVQIPLYFIYRPTNPYMDADAWLEEGYGSTAPKAFGSVADAESVLPATYRVVRPSRVARFTSYQYQRAEGTPLAMGRMSFSGTEKSPLIFGEPSPCFTPGSLRYSSANDELDELEMQPVAMTPIAMQPAVMTPIAAN